MNNLKRVLSLALSTVMLVGMMAMGASAAEFSDADDIQHDDAVNTLVALSVINGKDDGSFDPQGDVTRAEMAKMIAVAMNGGSDTNTGVKGTPSFTDIKGHWAESYIEYCYDMKIISGRGDGTFDPGANVTGLEATKMVLTALGYDAEAYKLTGASWAVRTDELAKQADPKLYEELGDVVMANNASRDTAAQLIWNGLQNTTRRVTPMQNTNTGEVTWQYGTGDVMLKERYGAEIKTGVYLGNSDSGAATAEGEIAVGTWTFPSDLGIENIGEEVRVVYKEAKGSPAGPDKKDVIYGVFNTGKTQVYNVTKNDIQDAKTDLAKGKIKFNDSTYDTTNAVDVEFNYDNGADANKEDQTATELQALLKNQSVDMIKFVCNDEGEISKAYVTELKAGQVTAVTASKLTIAGVGTIDIKDNDVASDLAKDDVVVYTRFYDNTDKDEAFFTVTKAETVEGALKGYKSDNGLVNVVVDGTTYKVNGKALVELSEDAITALGTGSDDGKIGDDVKLFLIGGMVAGIQKTGTTSSDYALIVDADTSGELGTNLNPWRVTVLLADGTEETLAVHKDSKNGSSALRDTDIAKGKLVKYSMNSGKIKITEVKTGAAITGNENKGGLWDQDTRKFTYTGTTTALANTDSVLFVKVNDDYYAYKLTDLGDIANTTAGRVATAFVNDDNIVKAAYAELNKKPTGSSAATRYGIISSVVGTVEKEDTIYTQLKVAVGEDEAMVINVVPEEVAAKTLKAGVIVTFEETTDSCYDEGTMTVLDGSTTIADKGLAVAVKSYSNRTLGYHLGTKFNDSKKVFEGYKEAAFTTEGAVSEVVDKDVKIVYVNADDNKDGDEIGVSAFDTSTGYANAILFDADDDGVVDVIIVETSGKKNLGAEAAFGVKGGSSTHTHTWTDVAEVPATCTTAGTKAYKECKVAGCDKAGKKFSDEGTTEILDLTIAALGHSVSTWAEDSGAGDHKGTCDTCSSEVHEAHYKDAAGDWDSASTGDTCKVCNATKA